MRKFLYVYRRNARAFLLSTTAILSVSFVTEAYSEIYEHTGWVIYNERINGTGIGGSTQTLSIIDGEIVLDGDTIKSTGGQAVSALSIVGDYIIRANGLTIETNGKYASDGELAAGIRAHTGAQVTLVNGSITSTGESFARALFAYNATINVDGTVLSTAGDQSDVVHAYQGAVISLTNASILSSGNISHGIYSEGVLETSGTPAVISSTGSSITTQGTGSYGAFAEFGAELVLTDTVIDTHADNSSGIVAGSNGTVTVTGGSVTTGGDNAHGLYANPYDEGGFNDAFAETENLGEASLILADHLRIATTGASASGVFAESGGVIDIANSFISTSGEAGVGLYAANGQNEAGGIIRAIAVDVVSSGDNSAAVYAGNNASITISGGSRLVSDNGAAIILEGSATVVLADTEIISEGETFLSLLTAGEEQQTIVVGAGVIATENNGTLLRVSRENDADGVVELTLMENSTTQGDIIDQDARSGGGTDVYLEEGASWSGLLQGVRNVIGEASSDFTFEGVADIGGNLETSGSTIVFSDDGGTIAGNVFLGDQSSTTGGSIDAPVRVVGEVTVDETSELGGNWEIAGNLTNAGIVSPGNSIGYIFVGGDLTFSNSPRYEVEINAAGDADSITVEGTANLGGIISVTPLDGFLLAYDYLILTTQSGLEGDFESVVFSENYAFIDAQLGSDAGSVTLRIDRNDVAYASVANSRNQAAVGVAADTASINSDLGTALAFMTIEEAPDAFNQLSGEIHASARSALIEQSNAVTNVVNERIQRAFERVDGNSGIWMSGYGDRATINGDGNAAGLSYSGGGVLIGVDGDLAGSFHAGVVAGYGQSSINAGYASSFDSDNYLLGLYGGAQWGGVAFRAGLLHTWYGIEGNRRLAFSGAVESLHADYDARSFQLFGEAGHDFKIGSGVVQPFANITHVHLTSDAFSETGGITGLSVARATMDTTFTTLGIRARADLPISAISSSLKGMIGWRHGFGDVAPESQAQLIGTDWFSIAGTAIDRDVVVMEAGIDVNLTPDSDRNQARLGIAWSGAFGEKTTRNGIKVDFGMKF